MSRVGISSREALFVEKLRVRSAAMARRLSKFRPLFTAAALYLALSLLLRLVLWWKFGRAANVEVAALSWILSAGIINDIVVLVYLLLPFTVYLASLPARWHSSQAGRLLLLTGFALTCVGGLYLMTIEYYFFEEFDARLNLVAVDYLMYPTEVIGNIRDAYPVTAVLIITVTLALCFTFVLGRRLTVPADTGALPWRALGAVIAGHALLAGLLAAAISTRGIVFSGNRVANELALNGISSLFEAARTSEIDYYAYYRSGDPQQAFGRLVAELRKGGGEFTRVPEGRLTRRFPARPDGLGKLNVVVVVGESFGAVYSGSYGAAKTYTPEFDRLARQGMLFHNAYASGTRTVRGLEAITASFPPIPSVSILRRPGNENIATWGSVMRGHGYRTSFLYGGYGYFDNMNYFYAHNGFEVIDRTQMANPVFQNVWGVSDEDLFRSTVTHLDAQYATGQPFFAIVMTTSNHKPYTFREGVPGVPVKGGGRKGGIRYADFALGEFVRAARSRPWFANTLFLIVADHGARIYGKTEIPLKSYRIPLLFYSPAHIAPEVVETLTGQIDIAPTVLGILGLPYEAPFFGQDVLSSLPGPRIALFSHNHDVAVLRDGKLVVLGLHKTVHTFLYDTTTDRYTPTADDQDLTEVALTYFQTAYEQFRTHRFE